jgi:hypothetical protein
MALTLMAMFPTSVHTTNMVVIREIMAENLSLVFVAPNLYRYLSPSDKSSLGEERPVQNNIVLYRPYGNPGLVRATHPQEIAAWYIQSVGHENATCDSCRAGNESSQANPCFLHCVLPILLSALPCCWRCPLAATIAPLLSPLPSYRRRCSRPIKLDSSIVLVP